MPGFSLMETTRAFSAGFKYSPGMLAAFAAKSGSVLTHQLRCRLKQNGKGHCCLPLVFLHPCFLRTQRPRRLFAHGNGFFLARSAPTDPICRISCGADPGAPNFLVVKPVRSNRIRLRIRSNLESVWTVGSNIRRR
jgi:hypothetical protein